MSITVITPMYNCALHISHTIQSVQSQTFDDWEYILVDDGSKDESYDVACFLAKSDRRINAFRQENKGVAAARNVGYSMSNFDNDYVLFLDNDDVLEKDALKNLYDSLEKDRSCPAAYGSARYFGQSPNNYMPSDIEVYGRNRYYVQGNRRAILPFAAHTSFKVFVYGNPIVSPGQVLIRKTIIEKCGGFDPQAVPADDWDFWIRLSRYGNFAFLNEVTLNYRLHEHNESKKTRKMAKAVDYVYHKTIDSKDNDDDMRKIAIESFKKSLLDKITGKIENFSALIAKGNIKSSVHQLSFIVRPFISYVEILFVLYLYKKYRTKC